MTKLQQLKDRLATVSDLQSAAAVLSWDQSTYMPPGGADARGRQIATLATLAHEHLIHPATGELLEALRDHQVALPTDSDDAALLKVAQYDYDQAVKIPADLTGRLSAHAAAAYTVWADARPANDFGRIQPYLETTVELSRELASCFPHKHLADPLIDQSDYGMDAASISALFTALRAELVPLVKAVLARPAVDDSVLRQHYPAAEQLAFGLGIAQRFGYDLQRGRQDLTHHPFEVRFAYGDVRITTRVQEQYLGEALFSTLHESGHAMYEQGVDPALDGTLLGRGTSNGVHESQSRLWENLVGRSRGFWEHSYPALQAQFPQQLGKVPLDTFYRAINRVSPSLIRTDADELTYNLHVIIRFDLELAMLDGNLPVADLPAAWHERYQADLGVTPPDNRDGCLQDVHWYGGIVGGAFQGYTLGNILSAQFYDAALAARPEIPAQIRAGSFDALHGWLREEVYRHGRKLNAPEVVQRATGQPMTIAPYMAYLRKKYGELYGL